MQSCNVDALLLLLLSLATAVSAQPFTSTKPATSTSSNDNDARRRQSRTIAMACGIVCGMLLAALAAYAVYSFGFKNRRGGGGKVEEDEGGVKKAVKVDDAQAGKRRSVFRNPSIKVRAPTLVISEEKKAREAWPFLAEGEMSRSSSPEPKSVMTNLPLPTDDDEEQKPLAFAPTAPVADRAA